LPGMFNKQRIVTGFASAKNCHGANCHNLYILNKIAALFLTIVRFRH
jgi:hypothetical protein